MQKAKTKKRNMNNYSKAPEKNKRKAKTMGRQHTLLSKIILHPSKRFLNMNTTSGNLQSCIFKQKDS